MNGLTRTLAMAAVLLGQLLLTGPTLAVSTCHGQADHAGMAAVHAAAHAHDTGRTAHGADHAPTDATCMHAHADDVAAGCQCPGGMHCGNLTLVMPAATAVGAPGAATSHQPPEVLEQPSLAYRRNPDRPPA